MRYMLLIHGSESGWDALSEAERASQYEGYGKLQREMEEHGHYVGGDELASAASAKLVRVRDGEAIVWDGPFAETKEQLGGHFHGGMRPRHGDRVREADPCRRGRHDRGPAGRRGTVSPSGHRAQEETRCSTHC